LRIPNVAVEDARVKIETVTYIIVGEKRIKLLIL